MPMAIQCPIRPSPFYILGKRVPAISECATVLRGAQALQAEGWRIERMSLHATGYQAKGG